MEEKYDEIDHTVSQLYEIKKRIGKGAYGIVWEAKNKATKKTVAVKKIFDAFRNKTDAMRTYREVIFMKEFQFHPNIIQLLDIFKAENDLDIYLVMERMDADLHSVIEENLLKDVHKRFIMFQLFSALDCLSANKVIHRDLKPSNILLNADCHVRVADFGLARRNTGSSEVNEKDDVPMTDYVATRWYRAPEILLADQTYTCGVDMWSSGCILGEMLLCKPLFPGTSTVNQIELIVESVDLPSLKNIELSSQYARTILEKARKDRSTIQEKGQCPRPNRPLANRFRETDVDTEAIDLLTKLLVFQHGQRLTAQQALNHAYVNRFESPSNDSCHQRQFTAEDDNNLSINDYRKRLYELATTTGDEEVTGNNDFSVDDDDVDSASRNLIDSPSKQKPITVRINSGYKRQTVTPAVSFQSPTRKNVECPIRGKKDCTWFPAAGLPSTHPRSTLSNAHLRFHWSSTSTPCSTPLKNMYPTSSSSKLNSQHSSNTAKSSVSTDSRNSSSAIRGVRCGRRQFGNLSNVSSLGSPKIQMQSYAQDHGAITASSLQQLQLGL